MPIASVKIKLPAIARDFQAQYSTVRKPTGIEYMLLTIIGTKSMRSQTWGEVLKTFGIPEDLFQSIISPALVNMTTGRNASRSSMIDMEYVPTLDSEVSEASFTPSGRQAYEKGVMAEELSPLEGTVYYTPAAAGRKYVKDVAVADPEGFDGSAFSEYVPNDLDIDSFINSEKAQFAVPKNATVFDIDISEEGQTMCYERPVRLMVDPASGNFKAESNDTDEAFLKRNFKAEDLISRIPPALFASKDPELKFEAWSEELPEWKSCSFVLPNEIDVKRSKIVLANGRTTSGKHTDYGMDLGDTDVIAVDGPGTGVRYALVSMEAGIEGFDGKVECRMAVKRSMDGEDITKTVREAVGHIDVSSLKSFKDALQMLSVINDTDSIGGLVRRYLSSSDDLAEDILALQEFRKSGWYRGLPAMVEKVLVDRKMSAEKAASVLSRTKTVVDGKSLVMGLRSGDPEKDISMADALYPNVSRKAVFTRDLGIGDRMCQDILSGGCGVYRSKPFSAAANLSRNIGKVKEAFGMKSPSEYRLDFDAIGAEDRKDLISTYQTMRRDLEAAAPFISGSKGYADVRAYVDFASEVANTLSGMQRGKIDPKGDSRTFGILLAVKLADNLAKMLGTDPKVDNLADMLEAATDRGLISKGDSESLREFRKFRNSCAHDASVQNVDTQTKNRWLAIVNSLDAAPVTKEEPGKGAKPSKGGKR